METTYEDFMARYREVARDAKDAGKMQMNHVCVRVDDIDAAERLLEESFGIRGFIRPGGTLFQGEKELSVAWVTDSFYLELMQPLEPQELGYETNCGHPIGHLSEIGFFVPDMDEALTHLAGHGWRVTDDIGDHGARMVKIDTDPPSGIPVELIDVRFEE
jgi:catechol 2,3-dioxygenase-like lactoylglutathione lyase family enzyme